MISHLFSKKFFKKMRIITVGTVPGNAQIILSQEIHTKQKLENLLNAVHFERIDWSIRVKDMLRNILKIMIMIIFYAYLVCISWQFT